MMDKARVFNGTRYENKMTSTLMKFRPGKARIVAEGISGGGTSIPVPMSPDRRWWSGMDALLPGSHCLPVSISSVLWSGLPRSEVPEPLFVH